jgi:hypothetical protein
MQVQISNKTLQMKRIQFILFIFFGTTLVSAQQEKDSIATEVINVISSYKPTISDAFKAKDNPIIKKEDTKKKKQYYKIKSTAVNSIFEPNRGGYKSVSNPRPAKNYDNYLKVGYGNYSTPLFEGFLQKKNREHEFKFFLYNKASGGGIKETRLNDNYLNTKLGVSYKNQQRYYSWTTKINYDRDVYNWYGLPTNQSALDINEKQIYNTFTIAGGFALKKGMLKNTEISLTSFTDRLKSKETFIKINPQFEFPINKNKIVTDFSIDILKGEFKNNYADIEAIDYGQLTIGTAAYYPIKKENLFFSLGAKIKYNSDFENETNTFKIYPDIKIDYAIIEEFFNVYGGINGDLVQNSYQNLAQENPYISPTLDFIAPTNNSYNLFVGLNGKLSSLIHYNTKVTFSNEEGKALFKLNQNLSDGTSTTNQPYQYGNSFQVIYDDVKTVALFGEITSEISNELQIGGNIEIKNFSLTNEDEAWNLPGFTSTIFANYKIGKWSAGSKVYLVGKRKDISLALDTTEAPVFLKAYVDVNLTMAYQFNSKWSAFIDTQNLFNSNYERFSNFYVQGFQVLGGFKYNFDL